MASDVVYQAIRDYLDGAGATPAAWSLTPLQYENERAVRMADDAGNPTPWVMVEMSGNVYAQESIGASRQADNRWDEDGQLFLHVFVESGKGSKEARRMAKALADLFRGTLLLNDTLEFMDASIGLGAIGDDSGGWFRVSVSVAWRRMEA